MLVTVFSANSVRLKYVNNLQSQKSHQVDHTAVNLLGKYSLSKPANEYALRRSCDDRVAILWMKGVCNVFKAACKALRKSDPIH